MSANHGTETGSSGDLLSDGWGSDPALLAYVVYRQLILGSQYCQIAQEVAGISSPQSIDLGAFYGDAAD